MKSATLNYLRFLLIGCNAMQVWQSAMYFIVIFKKSIQESLLYFFSCKDFTHELIWHFVVIMLGLEIYRYDLRTLLSNHPLTKMLLYKLDTFVTSIRGFSDYLQEKSSFRIGKISIFSLPHELLQCANSNFPLIWKKAQNASFQSHI